MLNIENLTRLAERAGFDAHVITSDEEAAFAALKQPFSICVAAPPFNSGDRYLPFNWKYSGASRLIERNAALLSRAARALGSGGMMFVYGLPSHLPRYAIALSDALTFQYWIAVRTMTAQKPGGLRPEHTGLLVLSKPNATLNRMRVPHPQCRCCAETLKDWGGKSHLMHPDGVALSDVWMDLVVDPDQQLPSELFDRILQLSPSTGGRALVVAPGEAMISRTTPADDRPEIASFNPLKWRASGSAIPRERAVPRELIDRLHEAPCLDVLKSIPSETVDLAFADPPFNLTKNYSGYSDDRGERDYIGWCKRWLVEYERVLKPGGALFVLNLPKWALSLADFLSRTSSLYLQSWIVWNSLPEPKGVLMPAHYALLYLTKGRRAARFNYCSMENGWEPFDEAVFPPDRPDVCQRRRCVRKRRASGHTWRGELTDIWHDIHRVRKPLQRSLGAKAHPCETPERLIDRIIRLTTNPGDLVLDAFAGTGATALVARRLARRFIAIEQDSGYLRAAERRMSEQRAAFASRTREMKRESISKRKLQLELQRLALLLGRLPTKLDVEQLSLYKLSSFESAFPSWAVAVKAARLVAGDRAVDPAAEEDAPRAQLNLFRPADAGREPCQSQARGHTEPELSERAMFSEDVREPEHPIS